jgi:hypothetical protein
VREYSDVATFGFWCRKSALIKEKGNYDDISLRIGKGVVFHSTPSNVPVNFAFSFTAGLLAGNANIIRLPGKDFSQTNIIIEAIKHLLLNRYPSLTPYLCFIKYPPNKVLHDRFSAVCDVRVIWGGDGTINELRQSPLKPRATEVTFADRYSIAVIHADEYLTTINKLKVAQDFYNDTYFSDQNACTTPHMIFWLGEQRSEAKKLFWNSLRILLEDKYILSPIQAVGKRTAFYKTAVKRSVTMEDAANNFITRINVNDADTELMRFKYNSGFFFEQEINELKDILPICGDRLQTLVYFGLEKEAIDNFIFKMKPKGIDRIVPMGKSMNFTLTWDGYDLIRQLSRKVLMM